MFDRMFFATVLPEHVRAEVAANPGKVPIIELYLMSGAVLDLCLRHHGIKPGPGLHVAADERGLAVRML